MKRGSTCDGRNWKTFNDREQRNMAHKRKTAIPDNDHLFSEPWHVSEQGVLLCANEKDFEKLHRTCLPLIIDKVKAMISKDFDPSRFMGEARDIALDALTDTCRTVAKKGLSLDRKNGFEAYVYTVARNLLIRKSTMNRQTAPFLDNEEMDVPDGDLPPLRRERAFEQLKRALWSEFDACFPGEDEKVLRKIMLQRILWEVPYSTIAESLGISTEDARQKYSRGLKTLKKRFGEVSYRWLEEIYMLHTEDGKSSTFRSHIPSICENNLHFFSLYRNVNPTEEMIINEKSESLWIPARKQEDKRPSGNTRRWRITAPHKGISDRKLAFLLKLLRESFHTHAGTEEKR